ncbi:MAG: ECF transporter S component [bacterium]|jgi:uncharacterized membrane protein
MLKTRQLVTGGLLAAMTIVLGVSGIGFIPVPTLAARATIMHIPVVLAAILEGPVVGGLVGLIFGYYSMITATSFVQDPIIAIIPRILIGVFSYYTFKSTRSSAFAAAVGTLTNTGGVLGLAVLKGYLPYEAAMFIALTQGLPELVLAVFLVVVLTKSLQSFNKAR